jgi:hypothetical protein
MYIQTVLNQMLKEDVKESWIPHINTFLEQNNTILIKVKEYQQNANNAFEASREWKSILESFENSKIGTEIPKSNSKHDVDEPGGFPPFDSDSNQSNKDCEQPMSPKVKSNDDPDDDSSSSSSSSSSDDSDYSDHQKQKKKTRTKKHKDNDDPKRKAKKEDKKYREIVKNLMRTAKNFDVRSFSINPDPTIRQERFRTWVSDLNNILSTESKTSGLLNNYPAKLEKFDSLTDRVMKTVLFSLTQGYAKQIVSSQESAYDSLIDLKRHCAQTLISEKHSEQQKLMNSSQGFGEKASDFLKRVRKQIALCKSIGCNKFDDDEVISNIILQGLNSNIRVYTATIAELKASLRRDSTSVTITDMEEIFLQ